MHPIRMFEVNEVWVRGAMIPEPATRKKIRVKHKYVLPGHKTPVYVVGVRGTSALVKLLDGRACRSPFPLPLSQLAHAEEVLLPGVRARKAAAPFF